MSSRKFYGPWIVFAAFITFGLSTGLPYYNISFFYDYFNRDFGWSREQITLGFPLAVALTIWTGPLLIHRFSPRKLILVGTFLTFCALAGFGLMPGVLGVYYLLWVVYTIGYFLSGPPPHQFIVSNWYRRNRGKAMAVVYVGVGVIGSLGSFLAKPLTEWFGYHMALVILGLMLFLAWPLVIFVMKDHPREMGQNPDGDPEPPAEQAIRPQSFRWLLSKPAFWLLLVGSVCSIGSIGAVNFHMKFVFLDQGFRPGPHVDGAWRTASILILWSSIAGRLGMGYLADRFTKKWVMFITYFIVAATIPLLLHVRPGQEAWLYVFAVLFGFGMGADYMLIPLMAAEAFGVNTLPKAMSVILPADTIGQTWFPYIVSHLRTILGSYDRALMVVLAIAMTGAAAIALLPNTKHLGEKNRVG
jgi:MFS family permease